MGSTKLVQVNCRIIAASNNDLSEMVRKGLFREDLFYRLNVFPIMVPPLRERVEAIPNLVNHFVDLINRRDGVKKYFSPEAMEELKRYDWPGNIRELRNLVERIIVTADTTEIGRQHVINHLFPGGRENGLAIDVERGRGLKETLREVEKSILKAALERERNTYRLAEMLGISQSSVVKKLKKHRLRPSGKH